MWIGVCDFPLWAVCSHRDLPVARSKPTAFHSCADSGGEDRSPPKYSPFFGPSALPVLTAVVTNTLPSQTMGLDQPSPGMSAVQATFSVADHWSGSDSP